MTSLKKFNRLYKITNFLCLRCLSLTLGIEDSKPAGSRYDTSTGLLLAGSKRNEPRHDKTNIMGLRPA
jgi:hypothetical protein